MAIDDLTDNALFEAYQKNPQIKKLVDEIQMKYGVHHSQKETPDYKIENVPTATKEAKEAVKDFLAQQNGGLGAKAESPTTTTKASSNSRADYFMKLVATFAGVALIAAYL